MDAKQWVRAYRDELKGIAILWVVFFHGQFFAPGVLHHIQKIGYGGVDLFFFLTGFGLVHSLSKNGDLRGYMKRRLWRIGPAYLPLIVVWMVVMFPGYGLTTTQAIRGVLGNLFMVGFWLSTPRVFNWYVSALLLFLALAPFVHACLSKSEKPGRSLACLAVIALGVGLCCIGDDRYMGIARIPIFLLGMAFAMNWRPAMGIWLKRSLLVLCFVAGTALLMLCFERYPELLNDYGIYWHPFVFITPPLCIFFGFLFDKAKHFNAAFGPLRWMGRASFEIYLMNIWMVELLRKYQVRGDWPWILASLGCLVAGVGYHWLVDAAVKRLPQNRVGVRA